MGKIFISYSHKDEKWKEMLVTQLRVLEMEGHCSVWDDRRIDVGDDWKPVIEKSLNESDIIIMMISADFLTSNFIRREEVPRILKRRKEEGVTVIPFIVRPCPWRTIEWLAPIQVMPKDGKELTSFDAYGIDYELALLAEKIYSLMYPGAAVYAKPLYPSPPPASISISKLPVSGEYLFGREKELAALEEAWADDHTHVVTLVAWGGVGKTALVNHWLNKIEEDNYRGARRVYGWSFYSQGAEEGKQASADEFFQETLAWFGDADPKAGAPEDKGRRLAQMVRKENTLLILDGMEPLQYPPGELHGFDGQLKDRGMRAFLRELAAGFPGLCVISSREKVTDLADRKNFTVKEMLLEHLSPKAGVEFLDAMGVTGPAKEIGKAVDEYDCHALALGLLGRYLKRVCRGDIYKREPSRT